MVKMAFHDAYKNSDPFHIKETGDLMTEYKIAGAPTIMYSMNKNTISSDRTVSKMKTAQVEELAAHPATCGIKASVSRNGDNVNVEATLKSSKGGKYELVYAFLMDNLTWNDSASLEDVYNYTVRAISPNYMKFTDTAFTLGAGETYDGNYAFEVDSTIKSVDCHVVVYA